MRLTLSRTPSALVLISAVTLGTIGSAASDIHLDGKSLLRACGTPEEAWISFCNGYVQGVLDAREGNLTACIPEGTTRADIAQLVYETLASTPALLEMRGAAVVGAVAAHSFPC